VSYSTQQYQFLSGETSASASPDTLRVIDEEVQRILSEQYQRAQKLLRDHQEALGHLTEKLLATETVDGSAVQQALADETVR
jgi:cell division protease FtsH